MDCKTALSLISDYLDGLLQGTQKELFEAHIASCLKCACELNEARDKLVSLASLSARKSPVDCWSQVRIAIIAQSERNVQWWRWVLRPVVAAPIVTVAAVLALFLLWPMQQNQPAPDKSMAPEYAYYIGAHSRAHVPLAFADSDAAFVRAEIQKASLKTNR